MAEVKKARLFLRRGTDSDRKGTTLCEGELGYSTDAFRIVIGDGTTGGGRTVGTTVHVSGGSLGRHFHTQLTQASAFGQTGPGGGAAAAGTTTGGFAMVGDLAIFPALSYTNAAGTTVSPNASATTVMMLTGTDGSAASSWVSLNSGIPWGNLDVRANDISGDVIHGGNISGDVTFSDTISTTRTNTGSAFIVGLQGTGNRNLVVTAGGQLSATTDSVTMADGTLKFLSSPVTISHTDAASSTAGSGAFLTYTNPSGVPKNSTVGLFQFVWPGHAVKSGANEHHLLEVQKGQLDSNASIPLSAAYQRTGTDDAGETPGGSTQFYCPLSSASDGSVKFQYRFGLATEANKSTAIFDNGHTLTMLGYM